MDQALDRNLLDAFGARQVIDDRGHILLVDSGHAISRTLTEQAR
jgi:hypothetical protein